MSPKYIHLVNGNYLGFIINGNLFSRDGEYLGWVENDESVWDKAGHYRGNLVEHGGASYILKHQFSIAPIPRIPRITPISPVVPPPPANRVAIIPPIPYSDGFKG